MTTAIQNKEEALAALARYVRANTPTPPRIPSFKDWAESSFWIPPDSTGSTPHLIPLVEHQPIIVNYALNPENEITTIIYSAPKKSGKTAIAAAMARYIAETFGPYSEVFCLANDMEQARGRVYQAAVRSLELDPRYNAAKREIPGYWNVVQREAIHTPSSSILRAVSSDYKGEAGSNPTATVWCVAGETEILTKHGWIVATELTENDEVATLSSRDTVQYQKPTAVNKQVYSGNMIRFNHRRVEFLVTPNHRVYGKFLGNSRDKAKAKWSFEYADVLLKRYSSGYIKSDAAAYESTDYTIVTPELAAFWGYYLSEGCYNENGFVTIAQSKAANPKTYFTIKAVMASVFGENNIRPDARGQKVSVKEEVFGSAINIMQGKQNVRYVPDLIMNAPTDMQRIFLAAYLEGDGWFAGKEGFQFETISLKLANQLMQVGLHCGYVPRYMGNRKRGDNYQVIHRCSLSTGPIYWQRSGGHGTFEEEHYEGTVVCPSLPNGIFFIRYNGKCCWTGNSELWGYSLEKDLRLWEELTPVPTRRSLRIVETYAGYSDEPGPLWDLWQLAKEGQQLTVDDIAWPFPGPVPIWHNKRAHLFAYIDQGPLARRMSWQDEAYYEEQANTLSPQAYQRLHFNYWTTSTTQFVPIEWYKACFDPAMPLLDRNKMCVLGVDAAVSSDCCAVSLVSRNDKSDREVDHHFSLVWAPPAGGTIDYSETLEPAIREICSKYNVVEIAYDAFQLHYMMTNFRNEGLAYVYSFSQGNDRAKADKQLYDMMRDRRYHHNNDPNMEEHLKNCAAKQSKDEDTKMRIVKKANDRKIDVVVADSMAVSECLRLLV